MIQINHLMKGDKVKVIDMSQEEYVGVINHIDRDFLFLEVDPKENDGFSEYLFINCLLETIDKLN